MESCGKWYQVHINPRSLQIELVLIQGLEDIEEAKVFEYSETVTTYEPKKAKLKGKQLLPPYIEKKSEKWYYHTQEKRWIIADKIKAQYILP